MKTIKKQIAEKQILLTEHGFTVVELLVVLFIITLITGISVANFRAAEKLKRVAIAADTVINGIRNAQNFTLTGKNTNNANPLCRVPAYYRVVINYNGLTKLFVHNTCNTDELIETYALPANTRFKANGLILDGAAATSSITFVFTAPYAEITANINNGANIIFATGTVTVESTDGSSSKAVIVDGLTGRIE